MWENTTPSTELLRDFCAGIGPLQLGVVLVSITFEVIEKKLDTLTGTTLQKAEKCTQIPQHDIDPPPPSFFASFRSYSYVISMFGYFLISRLRKQEQLENVVHDNIDFE